MSVNRTVRIAGSRASAAPFRGDADAARRAARGLLSGRCERSQRGNPDREHINTSYVEKHNQTMRQNMRRYTRLSNGFSRKLENHAAATALNYFAYNFIKIHRTLRMSRAMAAGATDRLWSVEDSVALWQA